MKTTTQIYFDPTTKLCMTRVWYVLYSTMGEFQKMKEVPTDPKTAMLWLGRHSTKN